MSTSRSRTRPSGALLLALVALVGLGASACGSSASGTSTGTTLSLSELPTTDPVTVRLGYFPNVTQAPALVGVQEGLFTKELEPLGAELETTTFNAGPEAVEAIFGEAVDITYIGPNPAVNAFQKSNGEAVRVVAGSTSGGAKLVVKPDIGSAEDLKGEVVSSPQLGNTQDVALRAWLADQGLATDTTGGGDVSIKPQSNADILTAFQNDEIAGAWVPTPWDTRLIEEAGGKVLVDEASLWPDGRFATTVVLARTEFIDEHPAAVAAILRGHLASIAAIEADPAAARAATNDEIELITGKPLEPSLVAASFAELSFTPDPLVATMETSSAAAVAAGLAKDDELRGLFALGILDQLLTGRGVAPVAAR